MDVPGITLEVTGKMIVLGCVWFNISVWTTTTGLTFPGSVPKNRKTSPVRARVQIYGG